MKVEWMPVAEEGCEHAFVDEALKSLCGRKVPRQLRLPVTLPTGAKCVTCDVLLDKKGKEPLP